MFSLTQQVWGTSVEIFLDKSMSFDPHHRDVSIQSFYVDTLDDIKKDINQQIQSNPRTNVRDQVVGLVRAKSDAFKKMVVVQNKIIRYGISMIPAYVFEERYVVYGGTLQEALRDYGIWIQSH